MDQRGILLAATSWMGTGWVLISKHATQANVSFAITCCVNIAILIYYIRKNIKMK